MTPISRRLRYGGRKSLIMLLVIAACMVIWGSDRGGFFGNGRSQQTTSADGRADYEKYHNQTFRVVRVVDGDTLDVGVGDGPNRNTRIRLWGIDTPETVRPETPVQHYGKEASEATRRLCLDKDVRLELLPGRKARDKYERLLAYAYLPDGRMLNRVLLEEGFAYADTRFPHPHAKEFLAVMEQARSTGRGLWMAVKSSDLPPYLRNKEKARGPERE